MNRVIEYVPLKGEAKKIWQRNYMRLYMARKRAQSPPAIIRAVFEYNDAANTSVAALWLSNRESETFRYPETDWDDDYLLLLNSDNPSPINSIDDMRDGSAGDTATEGD